MRLKLIENLVDKLLLPNKHVQDYINARYNPDHIKLTGNAQAIGIFTNCAMEYDVAGLNKTDNVLDIGANIGGFAIPISKKKCRHVYAVEPLFTEELINNIKINNTNNNITVLECGLGLGTHKVSYGGVTKTISCYSLTDIIKMCEVPIHYIKTDCEGHKNIKSGEWSFTNNDLNFAVSQGVRQIEGELHCFDNENPFEFINLFENAGFFVQIRKEEIHPNCKSLIFHAVIT